MRTARPTRLAAALGAGVLLTGLGATPALASPAHPAGWTAEHDLPGGSIPWLVVHGRRGGSAMAAAALNALAHPDELA